LKMNYFVGGKILVRHVHTLPKLVSLYFRV